MLPSKTYCMIIEDGDLKVSGDSEPSFVSEITSLFSGVKTGSVIVVDKKHKNALIDICTDYFYQTVYDGDTKEKFTGKRW